MVRASRASRTPLIRGQYWSSYNPANVVLTTTTAPGDIIDLTSTKAEADGAWSINTGTYGGYELVVPLEGYYQIGWSVTINHGSATATTLTQIEGGIYVNGTLRAETRLWCSAVRQPQTEKNTAGWSGPMYLADGDELQVRVHSVNPSGATKAGVEAEGCKLSVIHLASM